MSFEPAKVRLFTKKPWRSNFFFRPDGAHFWEVIPGATGRRPAAPKISKLSQTHSHCPHEIGTGGTRFLHKLVLWYTDTTVTEIVTERVRSGPTTEWIQWRNVPFIYPHARRSGRKRARAPERVRLARRDISGLFSFVGRSELVSGCGFWRSEDPKCAIWENLGIVSLESWIENGLVSKWLLLFFYLHQICPNARLNQWNIRLWFGLWRKPYSLLFTPLFSSRLFLNYANRSSKSRVV